MKIRVLAYYPPNSDFSLLETEKPMEVILLSDEISHSSEQLYSLFQDSIHHFEIRADIVIDQGYSSEDNFYELTLTEICATPEEANDKASRVLAYALSLL